MEGCNHTPEATGPRKDTAHLTCNRAILAQAERSLSWPLRPRQFNMAHGWMLMVQASRATAHLSAPHAAPNRARASPGASPAMQAQSPSSVRSLALGLQQLDVANDSSGGESYSPLHDSSAALHSADGPQQDYPTSPEHSPSRLCMVSREGSPTRPPGYMHTPPDITALPGRLPLPEQWPSPSRVQAGANPSTAVQVMCARYKRPGNADQTAYLCVDSGSRCAPNSRSCEEL